MCNPMTFHFAFNLCLSKLLGLQVHKGGRMRDILIILGLFSVFIMGFVRNLSSHVLSCENQTNLFRDCEQI